jgi:hypothetical protein
MGKKSIQVSEEFHAYVKANKRDDETMEDALVRLAGGSHPDAVAGLLSDETADAMQEAIGERSGKDAGSRKGVAGMVEDSDDP